MLLSSLRKRRLEEYMHQGFFTCVIGFFNEAVTTAEVVALNKIITLS
jgi:hypothetical protein